MLATAILTRHQFGDMAKEGPNQRKGFLVARHVVGLVPNERVKRRERFSLELQVPA